METVWVAEWVYGLLAADTALTALVGARIYSAAAPAKAAMPYVLYSLQAGRDVLGVGTTRVVTHLTLLVKAVGEGQSFRALQPIADRIDADLNGASGSVTGDAGPGAEILSCVRTAPVAYPEIQEGKQYRHLGGLYQIVATNRGPAPAP